MSSVGDIPIRARGAKIGLFESLPPGTLLDMPAGGLVQSRALAQMGYQVVSAELFISQAPSPGVRLVRAEANRTFPFKSGTFQYVLCREGIEHLENQMGFLRECARVLKPGGRLVLTTPNVMHLAARMSQFLTGQRNLRRGLVNEAQTLRARSGNYLYHGHVFMLDYFRLRYMLRVSGFDGLEVFTDRYSPTSLALAPLVPLLYASTRWSVLIAGWENRRKRRKVTPPELAREIVRHTFSSALLFGKRMIVTAVAPG